jgi:prophage regulatory protein
MSLIVGLSIPLSNPDQMPFYRAPEQLPQNALTILRRKQVEARTGLSRSSIYARLKHNPKRPGDYDPTFPKPVSIGAKAVGWIEAEIDAWLAAQVAKSRKA